MTATKKNLEKTKVITCVLPKGEAREVLELLYNDRNIIRANISSARGSGMAQPVGTGGIGQQIEKDVLTVVVESKTADELFEYIYGIAKIDRPHGGFMYMGKEIQSIPYEIPEVENEETHSD